MPEHAPSLPTSRYDRNFDLTPIYRDRCCGRVGRHSCLSRDANNSVGGAAVTFVINGRVFSSSSLMTSPLLAFSLSIFFFFNLIVKGPWCDRDDRRGDRIADVNDSQSLLSCHDLGTKGARTLSPFPHSSFSLFLLCFLPSRHREIRSRRRSAALKPRAGNGSRRPEAKCVRALSDRDGGGAVVLFLSRPCGLPAAYIRAGFWWRRICNWFWSSEIT